MQIQDFDYFNIETYTSSEKSQKIQELFGTSFYREENTNIYSNNPKKKLMRQKNKSKTQSTIPWWVWILAPVLAILFLWSLYKLVVALITLIF